MKKISDIALFLKANRHKMNKDQLRIINLFQEETVHLEKVSANSTGQEMCTFSFSKNGAFGEINICFKCPPIK